jgi:hypothetical protein
MEEQMDNWFDLQGMKAEQNKPPRNNQEDPEEE